MVRLGHKYDDQKIRNCSPDQQRVVSPPPRHILVDKSTNQRPEFRPDNGRSGVKHHRKFEIVSAKQVTDGITRDGHERTLADLVGEAAYKECLDVLCYGSWDQPNDEGSPGDEVNWAAAVKFGERERT
jgi:hypothetical protein